MKVFHICLNPFLIDPAAHSDEHGFETIGESLTVQADLEQSDINTIVRQFGIHGELPYGALTPFYDDITGFPTDFHEAENFIIASRDAFMTLPAEQRSSFDNDPGRFLDFIHDPANYDNAVKLGLVPPPIPESDPGIVLSPGSDPGIDNA